ncbi:MAG: phosphoglycerate mutase family protein [Acidimicrobiales bacterium]
MTLLLVRHAIAVARKGWPGDDDDRPLTQRGRRQAMALVGQVAAFVPTRVLSSPSVRCVDTVAPVAAGRGLVVECDTDLTEGNGGLAVALVRLLVDGDGDNVVCTHGDVLADVLAALGRQGARLENNRCQKGSTWLVGRDNKGLIRGRYLPPPS